MTDRQKVSLATIASLLLHLLMLGLLILLELLPRREDPMVPAPEPKRLEVTLVPQPTPSPTPPPLVLATPSPTPTPTPSAAAAKLITKRLKSYLDLIGLNQTEEAPKDALFESDRHSKAGSELPPTGSLPLPSQEGKRRPFAEFANLDYALGKAKPAQPSPPKEDKPAPAQVSQIAQPEVKESQPVSPEMPEPLATPSPTPPNTFALAKPTPVPVKTTPKPTPRTTVKQAQPTPKPLAAESGYQPQKQTTKVDGGISAPGKAGVAAVGSPLGRYKKAIGDAIGSRWYYYINQRMDLITVGDVHIKFSVNEKGRVEGVRILSNTANDTFASFCLQAVTEAQIPPPPPDILDRLNEGRLEIDYHFNLYPQ